MAATYFVCLAPARRPFANDAKRAAETFLLQPSPKCSGVAITSGPALVERPRQIELERALPHAEDIGPLSTQNPPDEAAAIPGTAHDLLDRDPVLGQPENGGVILLSAKITLVSIRSAAVSSLGLIVAAPTTERI